MAELLFIRMEDTRVQWLLLDSSTGVMRQQGETEWSNLGQEMAALQWTGDVVVMVPPTDVIITSGVMPSRKERVVQQALPYVVEEKIATEVEQMHFVLGEVLPKGESLVAGVKRSLLASWLDRLAGAGIAPTHMTIDALCLPSADNRVEILIDGENALVRCGATDVLKVGVDQVSALIALFRARPGDPPDILVRLNGAEHHELLLAQWRLDADDNLQIEELDYPVFESLARMFSTGQVNLLQWEFKPKSGAAGERGSWGMVATIAVGGLLFHLLTMLTQGIYYDYRSNQSQANAEVLYQGVFPDDRDVRDMRRRWKAHLQGEQQDATARDFYGLFTLAAMNIQGQQLSIDNINFNEQRGDLILQIKAGTSDRLVALSQQLQAAGLKADIGTINQEDKQVRGSVRIRGAGK